MIPREGTYLLDKGERVIPSDQNERITRAIEGNLSSGDTSKVVSPQIHFHIAPGNDPVAIRRELANAMPQIRQNSIDAMNQALREGGTTSRAAGVRR